MRQLLIACLLLTGCYAEWDVPKVPRQDHCTQETENKYVYVQPTCPNPTPRNPHDLDPEEHGYFLNR